MKLNSHDEWSPLREVILGTVAGFIPPIEMSLADEGLMARAAAIAAKAYPQWYLDEVAEDLSELEAVLHKAGVKVHRPAWREARADFRTPNWAAQGFDIYNMRDIHAVFGNSLIVSASAARFRLFEHHSMQRVVYDHYFRDGLRWIYAPPPRLVGKYVEAYKRPWTPLEQNEDAQHAKLSGGLNETFHRLAETEILFDAANVIRLGADILYLISSTGNRLAGQWLQSVLGDSYRVHVTNAYRSSHLDSTILPLRPGVVLLNNARVGPLNCPDLFERWDKLYFGDVVPVPEAEVAFHRDVRLPIFHELRALGVDSALEHISSPWAGLNVLSLDPSTVLVHDQQVPLIRTLEQTGFTVIPIRMRHCYSMLGGLHCSTLDTVRDGELGDYR
jgi:N-dimethylarginine dimethylaminohydrolase